MGGTQMRDATRSRGKRRGVLPVTPQRPTGVSPEIYGDGHQGTLGRDFMALVVCGC